MGATQTVGEQIPDVTVIPKDDVQRARTLHALLMLVLVVLVAVRDLAPAFREENFGVRLDPAGEVQEIRDFPAHARFAAAVWTGRARPDDTRSVYATRSHLRVMDDWTGHEVHYALPFGYSPTMVWLLGPLAFLPPVWGYAAWTLLGLAAVWWMTHPERGAGVVGPLAFLSPLAFWAFALGQTAVLSTAGLFFLAARSLKRPAANWREAWPEALVLWALTAKPPLALTAGVALLAARNGRPVVLALGLTAVTTLALTPWLGTGWAADYLHLVTHYDSVQADPAFAWCLAPNYMSNLRAVLYLYLGVSDPVASRSAAVLWIAALGALLLAGRRAAVGRIFNPSGCAGRIENPSYDQRARATAGLWGLAVLALLLLSPHTNYTEALALYVFVLLLPAVGKNSSPAWRRFAPVVVLGLVWLMPGSPPPAGSWRPLACFLAQVALAASVLFAGRQFYRTRSKITA